MSLVRKLASFATSPQGRRTIETARTKLDTPANRKKLSGLLNRGGAAGTKAPGPKAGGAPTRRP